MGLCSDLVETRASKRRIEGNGRLYRFPQKVIDANLKNLQDSENISAACENRPAAKITYSSLKIHQKFANLGNIHPFTSKTFTLSSVGFLMFRSK